MHYSKGATSSFSVWYYCQSMAFIVPLLGAKHKWIQLHQIGSHGENGLQSDTKQTFLEWQEETENHAFSGIQWSQSRCCQDGCVLIGELGGERSRWKKLDDRQW